MKNQLSQVTVTQTLSVILFSEQKLTHFTNISCEIQQNVVELIKHLSKHLPLRSNLATNEISLTKSPLNPAQCYTEISSNRTIRITNFKYTHFMINSLTRLRKVFPYYMFVHFIYYFLRSHLFLLTTYSAECNHRRLGK